MAGRKLTELEIRLARKVFGNSIRYVDVKVFNEKYAFFQPDNSGMTPNGNIYIHGNKIEDYGVATVHTDSKSFFIHEMVHVWQKQNDVLNPIMSAIGNSIRHGFNYGEAYKYTLDANKDLSDYRMEQQAQIIEDYTRITRLDSAPKPGRLQNNEIGEALIKLYDSVLSKFNTDSAN